MSNRRLDNTRERILSIALELFARQGYAGTSTADIAKRLGTSKSALYYHFASKEEILDAILEASLADYAKVADLATAERPVPEDLLGALIDLIALSGALHAAIGGDPSVMSLLAGRNESHRLQEITDTILTALAGPTPGQAGKVRAQAAFAVAQHGTIAVIQTCDGRLNPGARAELLAAAVRVLTTDVPGAPGGSPAA